MFVHLFKIILNLFYVFRYFSWLTSLPKLYKYRDISRSERDILWNFLEIFLGCWYTSSKWFCISCKFVSLLVGLLPYLNWTNIEISPVLDDIFFLSCLEAFLECLYTRSKLFWNSCIAVSLLVGLLPYLNNINIGIHSVLNNASFCFVGAFVGCLYTSSEYFLYSSMSVSLLFDSLSFWNYVNVEISPLLDDISI